MAVERRTDREPGRRRHSHGHGRRGSWGSSGDSNEFFGIDMESMTPKGQAVTGLVVGGGILAAAALVLALNSSFFWLIFVFGWMIFPAFGLFARGVAGLTEASSEPKPENNKERELLEALRGRGELSPAQAAMETSLTVSEADKMLGELAEGGHLDVRVRGGGLFYALWDHEDGEDIGELEDR